MSSSPKITRTERSSSNASFTSTSSSGSWLVLTSETRNLSASSSQTFHITDSPYAAKTSKVFRPISNVDAERDLFLRRARDN